MFNLCELLRANPYPGRGILLGSAPKAGQLNAVVAYFITGRSENSRNRVFTLTQDGIRTQAHTPSKMTDPSLIIYHPVRMAGAATIVTNGDQTDTIRDALLSGKDYISALRTREFEPDAPNYTPRISGVLGQNGCYSLSILKRRDEQCCRQFFEYAPHHQAGHFISTYETDGTPLPSFSGEPRHVSITAPNAAALADELWHSLNENNKISLFVRYINLSNGFPETVIINQYGEGIHLEPKTSIWHKEENP